MNASVSKHSTFTDSASTTTTTTTTTTSPTTTTAVNTGAHSSSFSATYTTTATTTTTSLSGPSTASVTEPSTSPTPTQQSIAGARREIALLTLQLEKEVKQIRNQLSFIKFKIFFFFRISMQLSNKTLQHVLRKIQKNWIF